MVTKLVLVPQPKYILFYAQGPLGRILLHAGAAQKGQKCGLKYVMHTPLYRKGVLNQQKWVVGIKKPPIV
jgi:hypothetical protein